jgi:hypothetical protein
MYWCQRTHVDKQLAKLGDFARHGQQRDAVPSPPFSPVVCPRFERGRPRH